MNNLKRKRTRAARQLSIVHCQLSIAAAALLLPLLTCKADPVTDHSYTLSPAGYDYTIRNEADLRAFAEVVNNDVSQSLVTAIQVADIELTDEWIPIGHSVRFMGVYNGNGYTISGIRIADTYDYTGFFGWTAGGILTGINLREVDIRSKGTHTGALVGNASFSTISLCSAGGTIVATTNVGYVGGLVGFNKYADISRCHSECSVSVSDVASTRLSIGGLVGENDGTLSACQATGSVTANMSSGQAVTIHAGGLVGWNDLTINSCYATGKTVAGNTDGIIYVGGLAGYNSHFIDNSYATGGAEAQRGIGRYAGTLVGVNNSNVENYAPCHASGNATGNTNGTGGENNPIGENWGGGTPNIETEPDMLKSTIAGSNRQYSVYTTLWEAGKTYGKDMVIRRFTAYNLWTREEDEPKLNFRYNGD